MRFTKFFKAINENQRRNANESTEGPTQNCENYKIWQGLQRKLRKHRNLSESREGSTQL